MKNFLFILKGWFEHFNMANILPSKEEFLTLSNACPLIPIVFEEPLGDRNPLAIFEAITNDKPFSVLFNSGKEGSLDFRYTFLSSEATFILKSDGGYLEIIGKGPMHQETEEPLTDIQGLLDCDQYPSFDYIPHFYGGFVGYFSYEVLKYIEDIKLKKKNGLDIPDILLAKLDQLIAIDHFEGVLKIIICAQNHPAAYDQAKKSIQEIQKKIYESKPHPFRKKQQPKKQLSKDINKASYMSMVNKAKKYIEEGDIYQANLSHRIDVEFSGDPWQLYKNINKINQSPFNCFLKFDDMHIVSSSPERLVRVKKGKIETRPIAGTRPRGESPNEDLSLSQELLLNEKERAEHIMLIDLERNDISKVCELASITVDEFMVLEKYSHVWHIVSNVSGQLIRGTKFVDILKACFPGGTITGCPKIRCMEIIDELEPRERNYYTGSFGYIGYNQDIDFNILIRTILIKDNWAHFHVGAGIVADSDPEKEYEETLSKAKAMLLALDVELNEYSDR